MKFKHISAFFLIYFDIFPPFYVLLIPGIFLRHHLKFNFWYSNLYLLFPYVYFLSPVSISFILNVNLKWNLFLCAVVGHNMHYIFFHWNLSYMVKGLFFTWLIAWITGSDRGSLVNEYLMLLLSLLVRKSVITKHESRHPRK